jgi:ABC-2 type transport system ATP-binding protein
MSLAAMRPPVIEVEGLHRSFGSVHALKGVDLEVAPGEVHALLGPNGAGKTTLMRILSGLVDPSDGSAYVLEQRAGRSPELRAKIGMVPPGDRTFYLRLSGVENLMFFARLHGLRRRAARERAVELLDAVGLGDAGGRPISTYSHGMQKRLSFARALLSEPRLLLVDEATHDLDPVAAQQVRDLTGACARDGAAVLWATQRIEELHGFARRPSRARSPRSWRWAAATATCSSSARAGASRSSTSHSAACSLAPTPVTSCSRSPPVSRSGPR